MEQKFDVELNFFYMHYNDAKLFAKWAEEKQQDKEVNPSIYARHAIIATVFASEALINRVLCDFSSDKNIYVILEKASTLDKWYLVPHLCCGEGNTPEPFDKGAEPFQSFKELIDIRNFLAHPKVEVFLSAKSEPNSTISIGHSKEEYPWLDMLKGETWNQTNVPKNPFEIDHTHAYASIKILDSMIEILKDKLHSQIIEGWLDQITVKYKDGLHYYRAPVYTIWGGYGNIDS